jgi:hypothetical protein
MSNTGGMMGIIFAVVSFLVGDIQKFLFFKAWAQETFLVENDNKQSSLLMSKVSKVNADNL